MREAQQKRAAEFSHRYADALRLPLVAPQPGAKRVLVIGGGACARLEMELCLIKALELAGCVSIPLILQAPALLKAYYGLLPGIDVRPWSYFCDAGAFYGEAESLVRTCRSLDELLSVRVSTVRVGGHAVSTARRKLRVGSLDLQNPSVCRMLIDCFAASLASAAAARRMVGELRPSFILTEDTAYTPRAEIFDTCLAAGIPVIRWYTAHKSSALMLKRYTSASRDRDINSLSDASWRFVSEMDWNSTRSEALKSELRLGYSRRDWYNEEGAQSVKRLLDVDTVRRKFGLDSSKKTAFIFPHISWDASFGRGQDLFESYDEWLVETARAACANDHLQWVIKIHPAHLGKSPGEPSEEETLRKRIGRLPAHVSLLPADDEVSTFSLFPLMDYCLTVRGTVGLEAACLGIPVLTGGAGRYDRKGFTIDSATCQEYLELIAGIQKIGRLSPAQIELAERYAYGLFLLRPLSLSSVTVEYGKKFGAVSLFNMVELNLRTSEEWERAPDFRAFADWAVKSDEEDFLQPL